MLINNTESKLNCKNISNGYCSKNIHEIMVKMDATPTYTYKGGLVGDKYFNWNDVLRFKKFLIKNYHLNWVENAKTMFFGDFIRLSSSGNYLKLRRCKDKARLTVNNKIKEIFFLKRYGRQIIVNSNKYPVLEGDECIQYLHEYVPFHLPQIQCGLKTVLKSGIFDHLKNINIIDVGSGPATVPFAFCRLQNINIKNRIFNVTTVEASKKFNSMIQVFQHVNTNKSINVSNKLQCSVDDFMNKSEFEMSYDWIMFANSITSIGLTAIGKERTPDEVNKTLNEFISNVLKCNKKLGYNDKILITFIEGKRELGFKFKDYLHEIENIRFDNLRIKKTIKISGNMANIDAELLPNCRLYKTKNGLYKPNIYSMSLLLELKE